MKKISLLIVLILCVTIGGVYATWTYTQNTDVADEAVHMSMNLSSPEYSGSYGTYNVDTSSLKLTIDPKADTTHTTALYITGEIVITFTPNSVAPQDVKNNGVASTFEFSLTNNNWLYEGTKIVTLNHTGTHNITWTKQPNGTFTYTIDADALKDHITLAEIVLDTKAKYDAYNTVLGSGQIEINVSDGIVTP